MKHKLTTPEKIAIGFSLIVATAYLITVIIQILN